MPNAHTRPQTGVQDGITSDDTILPESPGRVILEKPFARLTKREAAGVLLALVRDCKEITPSVSTASVRFPNDEWTELCLPNKTLRLLSGNRSTEITKSMVRRHTHELPDGHEWLILTVKSLTPQAKYEINESDDLHYICVSWGLEWREMV